MKLKFDASDPATWRGLIVFTTGILGLSLPPEQVETVLSAGFILAGLIGAAFVKGKPDA